MRFELAALEDGGLYSGLLFLLYLNSWDGFLFLGANLLNFFCFSWYGLLLAIRRHGAGKLIS